MKTLHQAGVHWVNIPGVNPLEHCNFSLDEVVKRTADEMEHYGISASSVHAAGPIYAPIEEDQFFVQDMPRQSVKQAVNWRPKALVVETGHFHGTGERTKPNNLAQYWEQFQEECRRHGINAVRATVAANLRVMAEAAAPHGIKIAIENMGRFFPLGTREDLEYFGREIQLPNVGFCIDSGHAHVFGEAPHEWINFAGKRLFETHFHDNYGDQGQKVDLKAAGKWDRHLSPGFGTIDWREVIKALDDISFPGPVNFETGGWPISDPMASFQRAMEWWETCTEITRGAKH